ncbi:MAG: NAD-dependent epimerase/dehydratase family protein, partial [Actinobacteria bacterium]|nr:NAD-dependent epimerase/dehydratase family protein [Actinomycetota bacterium]
MFYRGKKVLVTGGTGFVGTHLVEELTRAGAKVRIPIHRESPVVADDRLEEVRADLTREEDCVRVCTGVDFVFHAAGAVAAAGTTARNPMAAITTNLILTAQMLQAAWSSSVKRFLLFSSSTGYPAADHPIKEEEMWAGPTHPSYFGYGWMRRYLERMGEFVASRSEMKIALVRPTAVYGRWDNFDPATSHVVPALIRKAVDRADPYEVWGTGDEVRDFLHITDLARGCLLMLEKHATCDPVNLGYGRAVTIKDVVAAILRAANYENAPVVFDASKPTTIPFRMVDTGKARRLLGFEPRVSLEDGLADTVRWYRDTRVMIEPKPLTLTLSQRER